MAEAQKRGLPVSQLDLAAIRGTFDYISLINVFSHIPDFAAFMVTIKGLLTSEGELYFESSNGGDLVSWMDYPDALFLPDHLMFAGFHTLQRFLEPLGFTMTAKRTERRDTALWWIKSAVKLMIGRQAKMTIPYQSAYRIIMVRASLSAQAKDAGMGLSFGAGAGPPSGAGIPSSIAVAALMPRWRAKRKQSVNSMRSRAR